MPVMNQIEISPFMYRPETIAYFQTKGIVVSAFKALNRAVSLDTKVLMSLSSKYSVTPAQILLRWGIQKNFIVIAKTSTPSRMRENFNVFHFSIENEDMDILDQLTTSEAIRQREERERITKSSI